MVEEAPAGGHQGPARGDPSRGREIKVLKSFTNTPREYLKKCPECDATLKFKINPQSDGVLWV